MRSRIRGLRTKNTDSEFVHWLTREQLFSTEANLLNALHF